MAKKDKSKKDKRSIDDLIDDKDKGGKKSKDKSKDKGGKKSKDKSKDKGGKKSKKDDSGPELGEFQLQGVLLSHPHLFTKTASIEGAKAKFKANFIIDPSTKSGKANLKRAEAAKAEVEKDKFGTTDMDYKTDRCALIKGNSVKNKQRETPPELVDMMVIKASNDDRPLVVDRRQHTVTDDDGLMYGGALVNCIARFYAMDDDKKGGDGLFCTLHGVQYVGEGTRFGKAPLKNDAFADLGDDDGDDIPF